MKRLILTTLLVAGITAASAQTAPAPAATQPANQPKLHFPGPAENNHPPGMKEYPLGPDATLAPGVPSGKLSDTQTLTSTIYTGMTTEYWIYVPAQYDPKTPAALMVMNDGGGDRQRTGGKPILNVIDNLIAQKKIPVLICVLVSPGRIGDAPGTPTYNFVNAYAQKWHRDLNDSMRSTEYDTVSDRYARFLRDELLPVVEKQYNIRPDAYSHGIMGSSSGGIAAVNATWQMPDLFTRAISWSGSFASIQWLEDPNVPAGGQDMPALVLHNPKKNIRVFLQDGSNDQENATYGSWPMGNISLVNAFKLKGNDFGFTFGEGNHSASQGMSEFGPEMTWLWRDYTPAKTTQDFVQSDEEQKLAPFRMKLINREQSPLDRSR